MCDNFKLNSKKLGVPQKVKFWIGNFNAKVQIPQNLALTNILQKIQENEYTPENDFLNVIFTILKF